MLFSCFPTFTTAWRKRFAVACSEWLVGFAAPVHGPARLFENLPMSATLLISSASIAADGKTITLNIGGVSGALSPASGITGLSVFADGQALQVLSVTSSAAVVTAVLNQLASFASTINVSLASGTQTNLTDGAGNTPTGQGTFPCTNNSAVNTYIQPAQFLQRYDLRAMLQLSGDQAARQGNLVNLQEVLNDQAGELESGLDGRYSIPLVRYALPMPRILTRWVGVTARGALYGRRTDKPRAVDTDAQWAEKWMNGIIGGKINIPGIGRETGMQNICPPHTEFDHRIFEPVRSRAPWW